MYLQEALKENGKARHKTMPECWYITKVHDGLKFENEKGTTTLMTVKTLLDCDWEPYKEPCKHSPMGRMYGIKEILDLPADHEMEFICKRCLVPLEPTGWREINSGNADNKTK